MAGFFPSAAEGLIDGDQRGGGLSFRLSQLILRFEQNSFGVQDSQKIRRPLFVARMGQVGGRLAGFDGFGQEIAAGAGAAKIDQGIFCFLQ